MRKVLKFVAVFDYSGYKKGTRLDARPHHSPENAFVPVWVEEPQPQEPLKHTPEGVND